MMKIVTGFITLAGIFSFQTNFAQAEIRFGVSAEPYPPFTSKDATGAWVGWEIDFMKALCAQIKETCSVVDVSWEGIIPALNARKFDAILASMSITEKRRAVIEFSSMYYNSAAALAGAKDQPAYKQANDLKGKNVGVQAATIHQVYGQKYFAPAGAMIKTYAKQDEGLADLASGRLDYFFGDALALDDFLQSPQGSCCRDAGVVANDPEVFGVGVGLGLRKDDVALREKMNDGIKTMVTNGELARISDHWHLTGKIILPSKP